MIFFGGGGALTLDDEACDLIVILRNITRLCQVRQRGVREGG